MFDYAKLNGKIVEKYTTQENFSKAMGKSERTISAKLNGHVGWKDTEIVKACNLLNIEFEEIPEYFFRYKVHNSKQYV